MHTYTRAGAREREVISVGCIPYTRAGAREREVISAGCKPILGREMFSTLIPLVNVCVCLHMRACVCACM